MEISLMLEGQSGLTWDAWKKIVANVEAWGFAGLYTSDHFVSPAPPNRDALEMMVAQTYAAANTKRVRFGPMVAPFSFRDPVILARQAAALDDLSGGRMVLGVGAGWMEREHNMFGYPLTDVKTRMARLAEGLEVISLLLRGEPPVNFSGKFYTLRDAEIKPRTGTTKILVGGNGEHRLLQLAARYADVWNAHQRTIDEWQARSRRLDEYLHAQGRPARAVKRTESCFLFFGANRADLERRFAYVRTWTPELAAMPLDDLVQAMGPGRAVVGLTPDAIERIRAFKQAGVQELVLQWFAPDDVEGIAEAARTILPKI